MEMKIADAQSAAAIFRGPSICKFLRPDLVAGLLLSGRLFLALLALAALGPQRRFVFVELAVLPGERRERLVGALADVGRVDQEALLAAFQFEREPFDRRVGDDREGVSDLRAFAALLVDGVDRPGQGDRDLGAVEGGGELGQLSAVARP